MKPNQFSIETAKILSEKLKMPIEHIMHTPPHIIMAKIAQLEKQDQQGEKEEE
ncbi:YycC family protein [Anaerobacillus sp. MEB173]|uniref:YycC family protein n=1 Tax=Anaerobacillus sp. MEB173 TaxID=3383345 RepID=UPI003F8DD355